jgi:hypothetical protein
LPCAELFENIVADTQTARAGNVHGIKPVEEQAWDRGRGIVKPDPSWTT